MYAGKSTIFRHIYNIIQSVRAELDVRDEDPSWTFDDASFEKMGALMNDNSCCLLGFYDELSSFLTQINLYRGRTLSDTHELALFYNSIMVILGGEIQVTMLHNLLVCIEH